MKKMTGTILIIEDDAGLIDLISERIHDFGYETVCTFSATEALDWLKINIPLLMVLDYSLPDMTAKEFIAALNPTVQTIPPFVLATGRGDERIAVDMMKLGARDYIIKDSHFLDMIPMVVSRVCIEIENENKLKQTEIALTESEEKYHALVENSGIGVALYSLDGRVLYFNHKAIQNLGGKVEDYIGKSLIEIFGEAVGSEYIARIQSAENSEESIEFEDFVSLGSGDYWFLSNYSRIKSPTGEFIGVQVLAHDITERKKTEQSLQKNQFLLEESQRITATGTWELDLTTNHLLWSDEIFRIFEIDPSRFGASYESFLNSIHPDDRAMVDKAYSDSLDTKAPYMIDHRLLMADGRIKYVTEQCETTFDEAGKPLVSIGVVQDITTRKLTELALHQSREEFIDLYDNAPIGYHEIDMEGRVVRMNKTELNMLGYTLEELRGRHVWELVDDQDFSIKTVKEKLQDHQLSMLPYEREFIRKDGIRLPILVVDRLIVSEAGKITGIRSSVQDITELKRAENELQASRDVLNKLLYSSSEFIDSDFDSIDYKKTTDTILEISGAKYAALNLFDEDGLDFTTVAMSGLDEIPQKLKSLLGFELVNKKWKHDPVRLGKLKDKTIVKFDSLFELADSAIPKTITTLVAKVFNVGEVWVIRIVKKSMVIGDYTLLFTRGNTLQNSEIIELYANQVGLYIERLNSEKALRKSEEIYRNLVMRIPDGVYKSTRAGKFIDVNPAMIKMLGYESKEEIMGIDILSDLYFDISDRETSLPNSETGVMSVFQLRKKDGSGIWIEDHGWYNTDLDGNIVSHEGVLRDVTERKLAEEALRASEDKYRTMIENSNDLIWTLDLEGKFMFMNQVALNTTGIVFDEWKGKQFGPLILPDDLRTVNDMFLRTKNGEVCTYELRLKKEDDCVLTLLVNSSPIYIAGKIEGVVSFGRDITDRKQAERALDEKMNELLRFHDLTVDRELTMIELKKEVNSLLRKTGNNEKYKIIQ